MGVGRFYQGVNIGFSCKISQIPIEIQSHTPDSIYIKKIMHNYYKIYGEKCTEHNEDNLFCDHISSQMMNLENKIATPPGILKKFQTYNEMFKRQI